MAMQELSLGYFGKVGSARDYVRQVAPLPTARALTQWIEEGRQVLLDQAGERGIPAVETARHRLVLGVPGSAELLAGVIRPSADEGGRRDFPFATFTMFPRRPAGRGPHLLPLALATVWDALDDACDALTAAASPDAFRELAENYVLPAPRPPEVLETRYRASLDDAVDWSGPADGGVAALCRRSRGADGPLELPVSPDLEQACFDATFWLDVLARRGDLRLTDPVLFIEAELGRTVRSLHVCPHGLRAEDYPFVMGLGAPPRPVTPSGPGGPERPTFAQILAAS